MGTRQEDKYPLGSREPTPLGVQGRPVTISQNKPKAIIASIAWKLRILFFIIIFAVFLPNNESNDDSDIIFQSR